MISMTPFSLDMSSDQITFIMVFLLGMAPGIFWLWFMYGRDKWEPEPRMMVFRIFLWGMASTIPAIFLELLGTYAIDIFVPGPLLQSPTFYVALMMFVIVGPVEEFCKYVVVRWKVYGHEEFNEPMDGMVYGAASALGFAAFENVGYLFSAQINNDLASTFFLRALLSVPAHMLFASLWSYPMGLAKFMSKNKGERIIRNGLIASMIAHGLFNFLVMTFAWGLIGVMILVVLLALRLRQKLVHVHDISPHHPMRIGKGD